MAKTIAYEDIKVLYGKKRVNARITEIAREISAKYSGETVYVLCVLNGAAHFFCQLTPKITGVNVVEQYIRTSSYGSGTSSSGKVKVEITLDSNTDIKGQHIIIVEDIIDSGNTMSTLVNDIFSKMSPKSIEVCTLLDKPSRREVNDFVIDYYGFEVPDKFIVGCGLDYDQKFRYLPFIGYIPKELL